ncbi:M4 family metallopeptidase [Flavobacterium sp.]|uniref:M4 family metallopeptidase n=1 Tax=Flavobacterium sp. TaxID=239 RepID=UPI00262397E7|nr:M4 family metallopeptidase [Flavobacterium sp.]
MNKKTTTLVLLIALFTNIAIAQSSKAYKDDEPIQKTLTLENPTTVESAIAQFGKLYNLGRGYTYQSKKEYSDASGMIHQRHEQFYNGIRVEFGTVITHSRDGKVVSVNGELYNSNNLNLSASLSPKDGFQIAKSIVAAEKFLWEDEEQAAIMDYKKPTGELIIFPKVLTGEIRLAYKYDIYATQPIVRDEVYIDATTGEILYRNPIIKHANRLISEQETKSYAEKLENITVGTTSLVPPTTTAATRYSGNRTLQTTLTGGVYVLNDATRGNGILTYNSGKTPTYPSTNFTDANNSWTAAEFANANMDDASLDAHWGAEMTFDFWKNIFNRNSYNDNNAQIKSYVHYSKVAGVGYSNAFWNGNVMTYGDGSGTRPFTALDVCGHEIGHAVCTYTSNLAYQNQSGALNEGLSDIWGTCIEQYGRNGNLNAPVDIPNGAGTAGTLAVWKIGEDLSSNPANPLRSMSYPRSRSNPDTFKGQYYTTTADDGVCTPQGDSTQAGYNDACGVHNNSGVLNHWFYILTAGKSGTNNAPIGQADTYNVTGIGMTKSSQITYYAERDYLTSNATFVDMRNATLTVANNLYCGSSPEYIAVMNAWNAVNVGTPYVAQVNDVSIRSIAGSSSIACGAPYSASIVFENTGSASISSVSISYTIDGGAATNQTWNGTLPNCSSQAYPIAISGLTRGTHVLSVTTTVTSDGNATNNTKTTVITVNTNGLPNTVNTFDTATDVLVSIDESGTTSTIWERGTVAKTQLTNALANNSPVYATKLTGNYPDKTKSYLVSQCYDLASTSNPMLKFNMAYDLETDWDIIYMEYSTNGGAAWTALGTGATANWYSSSRLPNGTDCFNCIGGQWTGEFALANPFGGTNGTRKLYSYDLSNFGSGGASPQTNVMFRFVFLSDDAANEEGAIIDNFVVEGALSTTENNFEKFGVYPNPSNGLFNVVISTTEKVNITLHDLRGRSIYNKNFSNNNSVFNQELNFSTLSAGVYILNVESAGKKAAKKIIIN